MKALLRSLQRVPVKLMRNPCSTLGALPSPLWGGVGGGGHEIALRVANRVTPLPNPPPQGGREQTEVCRAS